MKIVDFLRTHRLFSHLPQERLEEIARSFKARKYPKGAFIVRQGEEDHRFFILADGVVAVVLRVDREKMEIVANFHERGSFFGEVGAMYHIPRTASIIALTDAIVLEMEGEAFERLVYPDEHIRSELQRTVDERLLDSESHLERHKTTLYELLFGKDLE